MMLERVQMLTLAIDRSSTRVRLEPGARIMQTGAASACSRGARLEWTQLLDGFAGCLSIQLRSACPISRALPMATRRTKAMGMRPPTFTKER